MRVKVWSVMPISAKEQELIRFIIKKDRDKNRDLANGFPQRFKRREGSKIFFDAGKRRYCTEIET